MAASPAYLPSATQHHAGATLIDLEPLTDALNQTAMWQWIAMRH
ncbi:hypothetical protein USDA257_c20680 [Sinorhizobium fredii USDA 257]|uniref:Uncharacterized protein n=1 Tax=Sinorhizobium fredii (strain USDA 257) TaxID=1185652 RepID=I3X444_SINF2|nr:hypothetical protein USDA257_c20680 [Sinorhizobium fredii USDA 257]